MAIMWVAFGGGIVAATHMGKLPAALPDIMAELNSGLVMGGWIASMISFTGFALGLVSGTIGDRIGQRRVLILGLLIISAGSLIGTFARSGEIMLLARFVEGIGYSAATVAGAGLVTHVTSDKDRKWSLGIWSSHVPVGFAGMLIGGIGTQHIGLANPVVGQHDHHSLLGGLGFFRYQRLAAARRGRRRQARP